MNPEVEQYLTVQALADRLSLSPDTIRRLIKRGEFPGTFRAENTGPSRHLIPESDIARFILRQKLRTT